MLGRCGFSQKLPELPEWVKNRLAVHMEIYQKHVRRFIRNADLYRLTDQPRRDGSGDRWSAFQYSLPDHSEHLLFVFRLPGAEPERTIRLFGLRPTHMYQIVGFDGETLPAAKGQNLVQIGITFDNLPEEGSALFRIIM
jgi:alpha-galactosidase